MNKIQLKSMYPKKHFRVPELAPPSVGHMVPIAMPSPIFESFAEMLIGECEQPEVVVQMYERGDSGLFKQANVYTAYWLPPNHDQNCIIEVRKEGVGADYYQISYTDVVPLIRHFLEESNEQELDSQFVITELNNSQLAEWLRCHEVDVLCNEVTTQFRERGTPRTMGTNAEDLYSLTD